MAKKLVIVPELLKAHVKSFTRKDGTFVKEHDTSVQAAKPKVGVGLGKLPDDHDFGAMLGGMKDGESHKFGSARFKNENFHVERKGDRFHIKHPDDISFFGPQPENGHSHEEMAAKLSRVHGQVKNHPLERERLVHLGGGKASASGKPTGSAAQAGIDNVGSAGAPTKVGKLQKLAASGWKNAAHKTIAGHHIVDSPDMDDSGPVDGKRRVSVVHGGHIAHFQYSADSEKEKQNAHASAESYAKSRKGTPAPGYI